jgi:hypothetical protein
MRNIIKTVAVISALTISGAAFANGDGASNTTQAAGTVPTSSTAGSQQANDYIALRETARDGSRVNTPVSTPATAASGN